MAPFATVGEEARVLQYTQVLRERGGGGLELRDEVGDGHLVDEKASLEDRASRRVRDGLDDAMTAFLSAVGYSYPTMQASGLDAQLVHTSIDWRGGLRFGDDAHVAVTAKKLGTSSFTLGFEVLRNGESVATAEIVYVCVASDGSGKRHFPDALRHALGAARSA